MFVLVLENYCNLLNIVKNSVYYDIQYILYEVLTTLFYNYLIQV